MLARARPARRTGRAAASPSRRTMRSFDGEGQPQGTPRRSARRAGCSRAGRNARPRRRCCLRGSLARRPPSALLEAWAKERPLVVVVADDEDNLAKSFRNLDSVVGRDAVRARGRRRGLGALVARLAGGARRASLARAGNGSVKATTAKEEGASEPHRPPGPDRAGRLREELQPDRGQEVRVPRPSGRAQDPDPPGRRGALRRQGDGRQRLEGAAEAEAPRPAQRDEAGLEEGDRPGAPETVRAGESRKCFAFRVEPRQV